MQVLGEAVARDRRSDAPALRHAPSGRASDYRRFCTTAWKVGNFLRNEGVRRGATVLVADDPEPEPVVTLYGAALLGATVSFVGGETADPVAARDIDAQPRALVAPTDRLGAFDVGPRTRPIAYGSEPASPGVAYFERDVWSENPTMPPDAVAAEDSLLRTRGGTSTHGDVMGAAHEVVERYGLGTDDSVAVRGSFAEPGVVVAGLIAPVVAGATVLFPDGETGDAGVGIDGAEPTEIDPDRVM